MHFFVGSERLIVFGQLHGLQNLRVIPVGPGVNDQFHRIVFPVHQFHGVDHGVLKLIQSLLAALSDRHSSNGFFPMIRLEGFVKIIVEIAFFTEDCKALDLFGQIIRGLHQLARRASKLNQKFRCLCQMPEARRQMKSGKEDQRAEDHGAYDQTGMNHPKGYSAFFFHVFVSSLFTYCKRLARISIFGVTPPAVHPPARILKDHSSLRFSIISETQIPEQRCLSYHKFTRFSR